MAQAVPAQIESVQVDSATTSALAPGVAPLGNTFQAPPDPVAPKRLPAHYLWAVLIARFLISCGTDRNYAQRTSSVLN